MLIEERMYSFISEERKTIFIILNDDSNRIKRRIKIRLLGQNTKKHIDRLTINLGSVA